MCDDCRPAILCEPPPGRSASETRAGGRGGGAGERMRSDPAGRAQSPGPSASTPRTSHSARLSQASWSACSVTCPSPSSRPSSRPTPLAEAGPSMGCPWPSSAASSPSSSTPGSPHEERAGGPATRCSRGSAQGLSAAFCSPSPPTAVPSWSSSDTHIQVAWPTGRPPATTPSRATALALAPTAAGPVGTAPRGESCKAAVPTATTAGPGTAGHPPLVSSLCSASSRTCRSQVSCLAHTAEARRIGDRCSTC
jgi:hypothetical protein